MQTEEIIQVIRSAVERDARSPKTISLEASNSPKLVSRLTSAGRLPEVPNLTGLCDTLGLEFYIGPPRGDVVVVPAEESGQASNGQKVLREEMEIVRKAEAQVEALRAEIASMAARLEAATSTNVDTTRRIRESELIIPTLILLATRPDGVATTRDIIRHMKDWFQPTGEDAETLKGRKDSRFSQVVRNMISHRKDAGSFIRNGYAEYLSDLRGLRITDKGRKLLKEVVND